MIEPQSKLSLHVERPALPAHQRKEKAEINKINIRISTSQLEIATRFITPSILTCLKMNKSISIAKHAPSVSL